MGDFVTKFIFFLIFILNSRAFAILPKHIVLAVGSAELIRAKGAVHFSNNKVIKAADLGSSIRVTGKSVGAVDVEFKQGSYHIDVLKPDEFSLYCRLNIILRQMRGLELSIRKNEILVKGELLRKGDWIRLASLYSGGASFRFQAHLSDRLRAEMMIHFKSLLRESDLPIASLQITPEAQVSLAKKMLVFKPKYEKVLKAYGFIVESNPSILQLEPLVRVNILVAEVRKNFSRELGVAWPGTASANLLPSFQLPGSSESVVGQINALETQGNGHLLAAPTLLCRSGKHAEFLAGGEIPIKIVNIKIHETTWKKYGVLLKVDPIADSTGRMSIALTTEVSMLDPSHAIDGIPGLLSNRIESHFDLKKSRTIALSGLLKNEWFHNSNGLPWLAQVPVLGYLFSSKEYKNNETELVIFVTPEVILPEALEDEDLPSRLEAKPSLEQES
jgi:pilus assembly protein CpaC